MTKAERDRFDGLYGRWLLLEVENEALLDLVRLLLMPYLSDAQLKRKVRRLQSVVKARVH